MAQMNFTFGQTVSFEEDKTCEFKQLTSLRPAESVANTADEYAVAFLNSNGGRIYWGIRDDRTLTGIVLTAEERDQVRRRVIGKLNEITPPVDPTLFRLNFHQLQAAPAPNYYVIELTVPKLELREPFYTGSGDLFVRLDGVKRKLKGPQITEWIKSRLKKPDSDKFEIRRKPSLAERLLISHSPVEKVAERFLSVFESHGIAASQLPRYIPQLTFDKLRSPETLLPALTNDLLESTASLLRIRRDWLEGVGNEIFECHYCYKDPKRFLAEVAKLNWKEVYAPVVAFCCDRTLNWKDTSNQPLAIVLMEKLDFLNGEEIQRYIIYGDDWRWEYWRCRIQLKAMARILSNVLHKCVPIYQITNQAMGQLRSGYVVPRTFLKRQNRLKEIYLDDFAFAPTESAVAKEPEEIPNVLQYIQDHDLEQIAAQLFQKSQQSA